LAEIAARWDLWSAKAMQSTAGMRKLRSFPTEMEVPEPWQEPSLIEAEEEIEYLPGQRSGPTGHTRHTLMADPGVAATPQRQGPLQQPGEQ
jgi:hypothetical protein